MRAAIEISGQGVEVALVGRDPARVRAVAREATAAGGGAPVHEHVADLTLMTEVRALAEEVRGRYEHVDVLANNAGALFASRRESAEGLEQTFALNHLAPFLLTNLLRDRLEGGRVITTASDAHKSGLLDLEDLQSQRSYAAMGVYGTSKLCNILFTRELARRAPELHANCFHPGVVRTGFGKGENGIWKVLTTLGSPFMRSSRRGAAPARWSGWRCPARPLHSTASTSRTRRCWLPAPGPGRDARRGPLGAKRPARRPVGVGVGSRACSRLDSGFLR